MIRMKLFCFSTFLIIFMIETCFSQEYFEKKYPTYGGGITFGYSYYFPNDLNDYIDLTMYNYVSNIKKEHIHTGIEVGLFLSFIFNRHFEIVPEFSYLFSRHSFTNANADLVISYVQLGGTLYYIRMIYPGINLRFGGGFSNYRGNVSWEYSYSANQTWKGSTIGFHGAAGGELVLSTNMSISLLFLSRLAQINQLKDKRDQILKKPDGSNNNLHLNFSGIEIKVLMSYYF